MGRMGAKLQRLEGSRFGAYVTTLAVFASTAIRSEKGKNRRLPGITQRDLFTLGLTVPFAV